MMAPEVIQQNPFKGEVVATPDNNEPSSALVEIEAQRALAEVQAAVVMAQRFPRNQITACDRIINACSRLSLAEKAIYSFPRGGAKVEGPSIRLAEAIAQQWGNIQFGIRELENKVGYSTVEAFAWDLETNTRQSRVFQVRHQRMAKGMLVDLTDPRDIYEMAANQGARRVRACILSIIPGDVVEAAVNQCRSTLNDGFKITPENIKSMLDKFKAYGVTKEQIEKRLGCRADAIQPAQMVTMSNIINSLNDGMSKPLDWFPPVEEKEEVKSKPKNKTDAIKQELKTEEVKQQGLIQ